MSRPSLRMLIGTVLAVVAIGLSATGVIAAADLAGCTLAPAEGTNPENLGAIFESAAVVSPDDVWVVGTHMTGPAGTPWAQHWNGTAWRSTDLALPPGGISMSALYDVKAFAPDDVWAVGSFTGDSPLVQHWDGTRWSNVEMPQLVGTERILTAIDGTSSDDLWIVGQRRDGGQEHGVVLHGVAGAWSIVPAPPGSAVLHGVTMTDGRPVVVGWSIGADGYADGLVATEQTDGGWSMGDLGHTPAENLFLTGVSMDPSGAIWTVGWSNHGPDDDAVRAYRGIDGSWTELPVPDPGGTARLLDVASDASGTVAVGQVLTDGTSHALVVRATDSGWTRMPSDSGSDAPDTLSGVAVDGGSIWAVGRSVVAGATYGTPSGRIYDCG